MEKVSNKDKAVLRELAEKQIEYAKSPAMEKLKQEWLLHNTFRGNRPMIHIELGSFENEIIPGLLKCEGKTARSIETNIYRNIINHEKFADDFPVKDYYAVHYDLSFKLFDLDIKIEYADNGLGHHFVPVISNLKNEFYKLKKSVFEIDKIKTQKNIDYINEIFGDVLPAKLEGMCLYAVPTQKIVHFMGMENMLFSIYDFPDEYKEIMDLIAEEYLAYFNFLESNNAIMPTTKFETLAQGSWCCTDELPETKEKFISTDVWGFMDSQETVGISADMFEEFIFPCYIKIAQRYGLLSYGCCEPIDPFWDKCISKLPNLRKASISPWCNEEYMGERLRGKKIIYHRKPSPNYLGVGENLDEDAVTKHMDRTLEAACGCSLEITQRDVLTVNNDPFKVKRYVEIIRERCELKYKK